ncbi:uncharacterized protein VP01_11904g1, partial [Puccinia sorghi]
DPPNLAKFITSFNGYLLDPECKGKAQQALHTFKQSGNVEPYTQQFNFHAYNSAWSDNILVSLYCGGLKENIRLAIVSSGKAFFTLPSIQAAMQLGRKLEANRSHTFKISPPTPLPQPTQMQWTSCPTLNALPKEEEPQPIFQTHPPYRC